MNSKRSLKTQNDGIDLKANWFRGCLLFFCPIADKGLLIDERVIALLKDPTVCQTLSFAYVFPLGVFLFLLYGSIGLSHQTILRTCEPKPEKLVRVHVFYPFHCSFVMQFPFR